MNEFVPRKGTILDTSKTYIQGIFTPKTHKTPCLDLAVVVVVVNGSTPRRIDCNGGRGKKFKASELMEFCVPAPQDSLRLRGKIWKNSVVFKGTF